MAHQLCPAVVFLVFPLSCQPYNATLSVHQLVENADEVMVIDNEVSKQSTLRTLFVPLFVSTARSHLLCSLFLLGPVRYLLPHAEVDHSYLWRLESPRVCLHVWSHLLLALPWSAQLRSPQAGSQFDPLPSSGKEATAQKQLARLSRSSFSVFPLCLLVLALLLSSPCVPVAFLHDRCVPSETQLHH